MPDEQALLSGTDRPNTYGEQGCTWSDRNLGSLCQLVNGFAFEPSDWDKDGAPIIRIQNLNGGREFNFFRGALPDRYSVGPGDLLFSWSGNRGTSFGPYIWGGPAGYVNQHIFRVLPRTRVNQQWLYHALHEIRRRAEKNAHGGSGLVHVRASDLIKYRVLTPAEEEQKAIADVLDAADAAIRETEALIAKLKRLRLGLIDDLLTRGIDDNGELRPEADLINSRLGRLPAQWLIVALGSLAQQITSGSRGWARYYAPDGALFLRIGNLTREHINLRFDDVVHVAPPTGQEGSRTAVEAGDMLVSITADLGIIGSVPDNFGEAYVNQHIALVRLRQSEVNPRWPAYYLAARQAQAKFIRLNDQGAKAGLNLPAVAAISLPSPPRPEQDEIVRKLDDFDIRLYNETLLREKLQCLRDGLRDDLLTGRVRVAVAADAAA